MIECRDCGADITKDPLKHACPNARYRVRLNALDHALEENEKARARIAELERQVEAQARVVGNLGDYAERIHDLERERDEALNAAAKYQHSRELSSLAAEDLLADLTECKAERDAARAEVADLKERLANAVTLNNRNEAAKQEAWKERDEWRERSHAIGRSWEEATTNLNAARAEVERQKKHNTLLTLTVKEERDRRKEVQAVCEGTLEIINAARKLLDGAA